MYCGRCGNEIGAANFCSHCGAPNPTAVATAPVPAVPADEQVRLRLEKFSSYQQGVTCPRCGYRGPVGFVRKVKPFYANCFVLALLLISLVGIVVILLLAILGKMHAASEVECPQCGLRFLNRP